MHMSLYILHQTITSNALRLYCQIRLTCYIQRSFPARTSTSEDDGTDELSSAQLHSVDGVTLRGLSGAHECHQEGENRSFIHDDNDEENVQAQSKECL